MTESQHNSKPGGNRDLSRASKPGVGSQPKSANAANGEYSWGDTFETQAEWDVSADCAFASDDLKTPALRTQARLRVQDWDHRIRQAYSDIPAPALLSERIYARLQQSQSTLETELNRPSSTLVGVSQQDPSEPVPATSRAYRPHSERRSLRLPAIAWACAAVVLIVVTAAMFLSTRARPVDSSLLAAAAIEWAQQIDQLAADGWNLERAQWTGELQELWPEGLRGHPIARTELDTSVTAQVIAYRLVGPGRQQALLLFVPDTVVTNLAPILPSEPQVVQSAYCASVAAAGQFSAQATTGRTVAVLVVHGGSEQYRQFVPQALAAATLSIPQI